MKQHHKFLHYFLFLIFFSIIIWLNKNHIINYFKKNHSINEVSASYQAHHSKIYKLHQDCSFGIDVSEYQDHIHWHELNTIDDKVAIDFVIIRATAGKDKIDSKFKKNWQKATQKQLIRGAYHYYRPNENSIEQAENFIKNVKLAKGDFPPILDIEKLPKTQSIDSLKVGLKRWLIKIENHYGVQPIIYSGESYYNNFLHEEFSNYKFWIANYNLDKKYHHNDCLMWQFSENGKAKGINSLIDLNVFNGNKNKLKSVLID